MYCSKLYKNIGDKILIKNTTVLSRQAFCVAALLMIICLSGISVQSETIASKIESHGEMIYLEISDLRAMQKNGLLNIQVEITNISPSNQELFYRFKWLDSSGFSVWGEEPWKPVIIYGKQRYLINVVGPTIEATDFRLQLQSPDNITD
jgi:uncharacterized protein YcfL